MTPESNSSDRSRVRQYPQRASYDPETVRSILDVGIVAHVGFAPNAQPFVIPMLYARSGGTLYLHGSAVSRALHELATGIPACVTVTLLDGLVLARSGFHHSMNYRSVVAFGTARAISEASRKVKALHAISEHILAGRWNDVRGPSRTELEATSVVEFSIEDASAKVREGPPIDDEEDYCRRVWAGVLPLRLEMKTPVPDPRLQDDIPVPDYLKQFIDSGS
jgi:nitroimidazol reductase NimA-like FMN-containing flavoprotein (pyridoxamine 5'-phosphate oxidase superfamily)